MFGAVIGLALIPLTKGRMREIMIFFTALMTATTGALAIGTPNNLTAVLVLVSIACTAVGAVVIPSTISCGYCPYCRAGYQAQCDNANPGGKTAGTAFFGGPEAAGAFDGLQAEYARVPFANTSLVPIPPDVTGSSGNPGGISVPQGEDVMGRYFTIGVRGNL